MPWVPDDTPSIAPVAKGRWVPGPAPTRHDPTTAPAAPAGTLGSLATELPKAPFGTLERGYESLAKPVTGAVEKGQEYLGVPQGAAKFIAGAVVPQTLTGAGLDVAGLALPELGAARAAGTAATLGERLLGSHLGRAAVMGGIGAGTEAASEGSLSGKSLLTGFAQGAGGEAVGQGAHGVVGLATHNIFLPKLLRDTTKSFGQALGEVFPWLGKMETSKDLADNFVRGGALKKASILLQQAKDDAARAAKNEDFQVPVPALFGTMGEKTTAPVDFQEADRQLTEMNHHIFAPSGDPRSGVAVPNWQHLAAITKKNIVDKLNEIKPGLGDNYDIARSRVDAAFTLGGSRRYPGSGLFGDQRVWNTRHGTIDPKFLSQQVDKHTGSLQRSMGEEGVNHIQDALKRGAQGQVTDIPARDEPQIRPGFSLPLTAARSIASFARGYKPVGKLPATFEVPHSLSTEYATQNIISELRANQPDEHSPGPGMKALDRSRAEHMAPTPSASKRAEKVGEQLRKGKTPEVHHDLNRGRLSMDETDKLIKHASSTDPAAMVQNLPLSELLDALEQADPHEREILFPMVLQRLKQELPQTQNKTLQANLSQRFQRIQAMPPSNGQVSGRV